MILFFYGANKFFNGIFPAQIVSSSAKLGRSEFDIQKERLFINILNIIGPSVDLRGTPGSKIQKILLLLFIYFLLFKCEQKNTTKDS